MNPNKGKDLTFTVRVTLRAKEADEMRGYLERDHDDPDPEEDDENMIDDALSYFEGWHLSALVERVDAKVSA